MVQLLKMDMEKLCIPNNFFDTILATLCILFNIVENVNWQVFT